ncbi:MAG: hypothetical protein AB7O96_16000 [Pseudobdellovibrionaceae bacterium]
MRLTHGFHQDRCRVSLKALERSCTLVHNTILKALDGLEEKGFIIVLDRGHIDKSNEYQVKFPTSKTSPTPKFEVRARVEKLTSKNEVTKQTVLNKTTTTDNSGCSFEIDISPLASIGFTSKHCEQLTSRHDHETLQNSIDAFAFDLQVNKKAKSIKGPPLNFFIGIMRKGSYLVPENFESRKNRILRLEREVIEKAEREKQETLVAMQREKNEHRRTVLRKIVDQEFEKWIRSLSETQRKGIVPPFAQRSPTIELACLRSHFEEQILKVSLDKLSETEMTALFHNVDRLMRPTMR